VRVGAEALGEDQVPRASVSHVSRDRHDPYYVPSRNRHELSTAAFPPNIAVPRCFRHGSVSIS
jgi:hypothetical protein